MKEPLTVEEVKKRHFAIETQADIIAWYIAHDKFKIVEVRRALKMIDKCYLNNLLKTAKHYFLGSLNDFQKCGIDSGGIKKDWEKMIDEIQEEIINHS